MPLDVDTLRADTRGVRSVIHLNNAGSSLMPRTVTDTVVAHLRREEEIGGYEAAAEASGRSDRVYASLAQLIEADPAGIALMESGSSAWASVVSLLPLAGSRVLLGRTEYGSNVGILRRLARQRGLQLVVLEDDADGRVSVQHLQQELDLDDVGLVALTHVPMAGGLVNDAAAVGRLCRKAGVPFILDACQSVGQLPLDVAELKCDILVGTGRKFLRGPRGTAFVYLDSHVLEKVVPTPNDRRALFAPIQDEPPSARLLESREASIAARLGLGRASEYALELGIEDIRGRLQTLADGMRLHLADIRDVELYGRGKQGSGIVTFSVREKMAVQVKEHLAADGINLSTVPLPPLKPDAVLQETPATPSTAVRASVHCYNTEAEIDRLASALRRLVSRGN
ncbi:aminotransferase class V-fold PLP-dependent enzyme [Arthrobacter sp. H5]|uniref:aminotransferase class V-fold PLP-dependent enzyme n=1 Tax=Arthrobacter sp. H5 TaxID=1267973 RepID=UPI0004859D04|nr:aminotransferase class V-fold PLP-dependent enzyme [Arthrobacter sp. H5]